MENLWKKESTKNGEIYVDLFKQFEISEEAYRVVMKFKTETNKNNNTSTDRRNQGNDQFKNNKFEEAMELYNQSLCFAECGTENVGLAYANRASCFMKLEMYEEALIDIDLAKQQNYPQRLMPKLEKRRADCLRLIKANPPQKHFQPKLSFDADKNIPCMANVLEIKRDQKYGRCIMAKCDIDVGKTIFIEPISASGYNETELTSCITCFKIKANFIPCPDCTSDNLTAMYCSTDCMQRDSSHKIICGGIPFFGNNMEIHIRMISSAISLFASIEDMMHFVEEAVANKGSIPKSLNDQKSKYKLFLTLWAILCETTSYYLYSGYRLFLTLYGAPTIKKLFNSKEKQRFLHHLCVHHIFIGKNNFFQDPGTKHTNLTPMMCLINHSCAPNTTMFSIDDCEVLTIARPVKKGEQIFICYGNELGDESTHSSREFFMKNFGFLCMCDKCEPRCSHADEVRIVADPSFQHVFSNYETAFDDKTERIILKDECIRILQRYGRLPWCDALALVYRCYLIWLSVYIKEDFE